MTAEVGDAPCPPVQLSTTGYEEILKNIHDAVYTLDPEGTITWVNEVAVEEFDGGYTREELIGAPVTKILSIEDVERCADLIADLVENDPEGSRRCEIELITAEDRTIPCDLHLALLPAEDGSFSGTLGVARDITDQRHREQGLSVMNRVLRHNLRNELTLVMGGLDRMDADGSAARSVIEDAIDRLLRTSEKARTIQRVVVGVHDRVDPIQLDELVNDRVSRAAERFPEAEIRSTAREPCRVPGEGALEPVIDELLENAVDHADGERPVVDVEVEPPTADDTMATLTVTDDGPGIPEPELEAIDADAESPLVHSSGLGLWLVTWTIERLGGDVRFETEADGGTRVRVRLPTVEPSD